MAATVALGLGSQVANPTVPGSRRSVMATVTPDTSYPAGGYALTAAMFGLTTLDSCLVHGTSQLGRYCAFIPGTAKLQFFLPAVTTSAAVDMTATTDLHLDSVVVTASGT